MQLTSQSLSCAEEYNVLTTISINSINVVLPGIVWQTLGQYCPVFLFNHTRTVLLITANQRIAFISVIIIIIIIIIIRLITH